MRDTDRPQQGSPKPAQPQPVGTTLTDMGHSDPKALLPLLRLQLKRDDSPALLLKVARAAADATEWEEAAVLAKRLVQADGNIHALEILGDALFELGRHDDLEVLWGHASLLQKSITNHHEGTPPPVSPLPENDGSPLPLSVTTELNRLPPPVGRMSLRLAQHLLKRGSLKEGLHLRRMLRPFKSIMAHRVAADTSIPWWSDTDADTPLLVLAEQALGEQILWAAAFGELSRRYPGSVVECEERLLPIFARSFPSLRFLSKKESEIATLSTASYRKIPASELDYLLGTRIEKKTPTKWLEPDAQKTAAFREKYRQVFPNAPRVGLSWRSHVPRYGSFKSVSLCNLSELMNTAGYGFISLQYGDLVEDLRIAASQGCNTPFIDVDVDAVRDVDTWAAQVAAMDVVITPSNTTAHMAAALGVPTILLLPSPVSVLYYWGYEGRSTPWYPYIVDIVRSNGDPLRMIDEAKAAMLRAAPPSSPR